MEQRTGHDIDDYCGKCKMSLAHVIVAMVGPKVQRVQCKTCHSPHNYHGYRRAEKSRSSQQKSATAAKKAAPKAMAIPKGEQFLREHSHLPARHYTLSASYEEGELISHGRFGLGQVTTVSQTGKMEVFFGDGQKRILICKAT